MFTFLNYFNMIRQPEQSTNKRCIGNEVNQRLQGFIHKHLSPLKGLFPKAEKMFREDTLEDRPSCSEMDKSIYVVI